MSQALPRCAALLVASLCLLGGAAGQAIEALPEALRPFWTRWTEARRANQDEELDRAVRRDAREAEAVLDVLLDDISKREDEALHHEIRLLAWSLDRVERTTRYIERSRLVFGLPIMERARRRQAMDRYEKALALETAAREERSEEAWKAALAEYAAAAEAFAGVKDLEHQVFCHTQAALIELERQRYWHQGQQIKRVVELAAQLPFEDPSLEHGRAVLADLKTRGFDADLPEPSPGSGGKAADTPTGPGGRALTSFAPGAEAATFALAFKAPKKGLPELELPGFAQVDQYQLWQGTWVEKDGPGDLDLMRNGRLRPDGGAIRISRSALETFELDGNGDGKPDATFPASTTPQRVEVTTVNGRTWPIMIVTLGSAEKMFDAEFNYAPTEAGARLRFHLASFWEGEVLGETWQVFDTNQDGTFGVAFENYDDLVTEYRNEDDHVSWFEPDAVRIGGAKRAVPLSSVLAVGERWFRCTPDPAQEALTLQELHLATGTVVVDAELKTPFNQLLVREVGKLEGAFFDILPERKGRPVTLPVGTYQICQGRIAKGSKTSQDQVRVYTGNSTPFTVEAGQATTLQLGAPFQLTFRTAPRGAELAVDTATLRVFGRGGEEYAVFFDDPLQPELETRIQGGGKYGKPVKLRRMGVGEWETSDIGERLLHFPLEHRVEVPVGQTLEFKLSQKAHSLLGGPFESAWVR